jgi:hypothetical protein
MAHDSQIHDSEEPEEPEYAQNSVVKDYLTTQKPGVCPRCAGSGFPFREEQERGGPFRGVVYSRSSPVRCSCQGGA